MNSIEPNPAQERLLKLAADLLAKAGIPGEFTLSALPGGRNNLVFRLDTAQGPILFKEYFFSEHDTRDRLKHEYLLLEYLRQQNSPYAARPYAVDAPNHVALMEFIAGSRIELEEVDADHVGHASAFFTDLNRGRFEPSGKALPLASEACFSLPEHVQTTQRRVDRLTGIQGEQPIDQEARRFADETLLPLWENIRARIERAIRAGEHSAESLSEMERCLSPSDFGFHNALRQDDGLVRFVDFEYAGWDDPAKLIADFANQPDMTLERSLSDQFTYSVIAQQEDPEKLRVRIRLLEPLYQIKWACICLNDFLAVGKSRRHFTGDAHETERKAFQLQRARKMGSRAAETFAKNN